MGVYAQQLLSGVPYSPPTELAAPINSVETTITVVDGSKLGAAPNVAVIGADENAETISYGSLIGNMLSGCVRGVEGTARTWNAGELIARNFTNKDFSMINTGIQAVDTALVNHEGNSQPHTFTDGATTYRWGLRADSNGELIFTYTEVE